MAWITRAVVGTTLSWLALGPALAEAGEGEQKIADALASRGTFEFAETPLGAVCSSVADKHGVNVWIDRAALNEAALTVDPLITCHLKDVTLSAALDLMCGGAGMDWLVRDDVLVFTTQQRAKTLLETRFYQVFDLTSVTINGMTELLTLIGSTLGEPRLLGPTPPPTELVNPVTGEPLTVAALLGDDRPTMVPFQQVLVVRDTQRRHRALEKLLADLRAALAPPASPESPTDAPVDATAAPGM